MENKTRHCNICSSNYHTTEGHTDNRMFGESTVLNEILKKIEKIINDIDFYELREEIRLYCFDDDKDYVSYFRKWLKQEIKDKLKSEGGK